MPTAYNRQLKDKDDNLIYPVLNSDSIPGNAVTTAKINDGAVTSAKIGAGEVKATNIDFTTLGFGNYSTSEVDTGFTWIDGKHIYKKTINTGALPNVVTKTVAHNISNLYRVIKMEGYAYNGSTNIGMPLVSTNASYNVQVTVTSTIVGLACEADRSAFTESYVTLYYTKSS